jgi:DNA-binding XRE family transcriptional regulator
MIERGHANPSWGAAVDIAEALDVLIADLAKRSEKQLRLDLPCGSTQD